MGKRDLTCSLRYPSQEYSGRDRFICIWNVIQCLVIALWRGAIKVESEDDNFFHFQFCLIVFLINLFVCFLLSRRQSREKHSSLSFYKYGLIIPLCIYILSVLFGAPLLKHWDRTISFSMLGSALLLPSVVTSGKLGNFSSFAGLDWIGTNELWTCIGAWLGAFVIPLDWDRPWQIWPEPCCLGAVLGCGFSCALRLSSAALSAAGYQMYWPTDFFVHERHV